MARTAEALSAMKLLKACAWEDLFARRIRDARGAELRQLRVSVGLEMLFGVLWECVPLLVALVSFAVFSLTGGTLTAPRIFTSLALFDIIRFPLLVFPDLISQARTVAPAVLLRRVGWDDATLCGSCSRNLVTLLTGPGKGNLGSDAVHFLRHATGGEPVCFAEARAGLPRG